MVRRISLFSGVADAGLQETPAYHSPPRSQRHANCDRDSNMNLHQLWQPVVGGLMAVAVFVPASTCHAALAAPAASESATGIYGNAKEPPNSMDGRDACSGAPSG